MSFEPDVAQATHRFSLVYLGVTDLTDELGSALFEAGCDDATIGLQDGVFFLDFGRSASTFRDALMSAIADVERAGQPLRLVRVQSL